MSPWSLRPRPLRGRELLGVGAGALVASFYIGTADITIATRMGALFGFSMWWTYFVLGAAAWAMMDMSVRYFLRFGRTPLGLFKELHPALAGYLFLTVVVTTILGAWSQWNACATVLTGFFPSLPHEAAGGLAAGAAFLFLALGVYRRLEQALLLGLVALVVLFGAAAFQSGGWSASDALAGLVPSLPSARQDAWFGLLQSNAGSLINAWMILVYPYTMLEKGWRSEEVRDQVAILHRVRWDYGVGIAAAGIVALPVMAAATAVAAPFGILPENPTEFAGLLEPVAGPAARAVFQAGLLLAAWTAGVGWMVCGAYAILDLGNLKLRLDSRPFRLSLLIFGLASASILFLRVNPFYGIRIFAAFLSVVFPVVALAMVWRASRPDMGYFRWWPRNARGLLVLSADVFALLVSLYVGWGILSGVVAQLGG